MVGYAATLSIPNDDFQYSLCRVVLMVPRYASVLHSVPVLSVLALSSRFDGRFVFV